MNKQNVWVLIVNEHACDTHVEVFDLEGSAIQALVDYCGEMWEPEWGNFEELYSDDIIERYSEERDMKYEIIQAPFYS